MPHTMYKAAENNRDSPYYFIINIEMPKRDASSPQNNTVIFWLNPPPTPLISPYIYLISIYPQLIIQSKLFCSKFKVWTKHTQHNLLHQVLVLLCCALSLNIFTNSIEVIKCIMDILILAQF